MKLGARLGVPVRHCDPRIRYLGDFYGQLETGEPLAELIAPESLVGLLDRLEPGVTELACHPGYADDLESTYTTERELELVALCDARVRERIERLGIELRDFRSFPAASL